LEQQVNLKHDWLSLISVSGLLISESVLQSEFPDGLRSLPEWKYMKTKKERMRFETNYYKKPTDSIRDWLNFIFEELLEIDSKYWKKHPDIPQDLVIDLTEYNQTLRPNRVLLDENNKPVLLVVTYPLEQPIDKQENKTGRWKASPFVKLDRMLRDTGISLGLVTNGEDFRLVYAATGLSTSYLTWNAQAWVDEKVTMESFINLLDCNRIFGKNNRKIIDLIEESQEHQVEITNQLGGQVRDALEILIRAMDKADKATGGKLLSSFDGDELYHITLTVLMRLVFLLYAEENFLLPHGQLMYDRSYGITHLIIKLLQDDRKSDRILDENSDAWNRILATFRLIHDGSSHPDLPLHGYGGDLFNPVKFPILENIDFRISNRDIFDIVRKLTFAQSKLGKITIAQRLSYRSLDVEQIGSIYENLIDYTVKRAEEDLIVLKTKDADITSLSDLQSLSEDGLIEYLSELTKRSPENIKKLCDNNIDKINLKEKISDIVEASINQGELYLTQKKGERKGSGSFYTPKEITSFLVRRVLENLVYDKVDSKLKIKSPEEILSLNVCDPAMGSGAFLVQACRYLAQRLVESWDKLLVDNHTALTLPYGKPSNGKIEEEIIPDDRDTALVMAKRLIAERCLHGVDLNPLSVELTKMSLWLTTLSKDRPFSFLDHHIKNGNSLIGCSTELVIRYPSQAWERTPMSENEESILDEFRRTIKKQTDLMKNGQGFLFQPLDIINGVEQNVIRKLEEIDRISIFEPDKKEYIYSQYYGSDEVQGIKMMFDGWTSIWFWPVKKDIEDQIPLLDTYYDFLDQLNSFDSESNDKYQHRHEMVSRISENHKFFHWQLEFPDVFFRDNPGFDATQGFNLDNARYI
jgi:hypothetical protein